MFPSEPYDVWCPELGVPEEDRRTTRARSPREAAVDWAFQVDALRGDHRIATGRLAPLFFVCHADRPTTEARVYRISGEFVPQYEAVELKWELRGRPKRVAEFLASRGLNCRASTFLAGVLPHGNMLPSD